MNYLNLGPISIRISRKHLANWGFPLAQIGGLSLFSRDNTGRLHLAGYHPKGCTTWHWFVTVYRDKEANRGFFNNEWRKGYGERGLRLLGWTFAVHRQSWHKEQARSAAPHKE